MKFFHLSDLHIGLKLFNRELYKDQAHIFDQICEAARQEQPDAVIIAGDIYDKAVPSADAVAAFDDFMGKLVDAVPNAEIMMISGNHDSAVRLNVYRQILWRQKIHMIGNPPKTPDEKIEKVTLQDSYGPVHFYLLPFVKPSTVRGIVGVDASGNPLSYDAAVHALIERENIDTSQRNVLVSHQFYLPVGADPDKIERMDSEYRTVGNIDEVRADVLELFDYAALGHIHKPMCVGGTCYRYCGTPMACSVSESGQQKGIVMVEMNEKGNTVVSVLPLIPLRQIRSLKGTLAEVLTQASCDYVSVTLTDREDLDVINMKDQLDTAFPNLLEIRRDIQRRENYQMPDLGNEEMDPFSLCSMFLGEVSPQDAVLLQDVINTVQEVQE